jgi:polysaccharide pyruvyl transferase WcaK-like protein
LPVFLLKAFTGISIGSNETKEIIDAYARADMIINIWGILFCKGLGNVTFKRRIREGIHFLFGKLFRKLVVKYTADIGPFDSGLKKYIGKFYLQHCVDLILARNDTTKKRLRKLGVSTPTVFCPDTAFLLESCETPLSERLSHEILSHPLIGFSVSHQAVKQSSDPNLYLSSMARLADYIINRINAKIVLIPNEFSENSLNDDLFIAQEIWKRMLEQNNVIILSENYNAWEMNGIIGKCDALIGSRYHSIALALSQGIPVLAVGWHSKYPEILGLFGQEKYQCELKALSLDDLKDKFDKLWNSKNQIIKKINDTLPQIREKIFQGGKEVKLLLSKKSYNK